MADGGAGKLRRGFEAPNHPPAPYATFRGLAFDLLSLAGVDFEVILERENQLSASQAYVDVSALRIRSPAG